MFSNRCRMCYCTDYIVGIYFQGSENVNPMPAKPAKPRKGGLGPKRLKNFSTKEDEILCSAYLNVSKDPIVAVNQSSGSYWARITAYCEEHNCPRSKSSLQHRWGDIQKDTSRFCGFYAEVERKTKVARVKMTRQGTIRSSATISIA